MASAIKSKGWKGDPRGHSITSHGAYYTKRIPIKVYNSFNISSIKLPSKVSSKYRVYIKELEEENKKIKTIFSSIGKEGITNEQLIEIKNSLNHVYDIVDKMITENMRNPNPELETLIDKALIFAGQLSNLVPLPANLHNEIKANANSLVEMYNDTANANINGVDLFSIYDGSYNPLTGMVTLKVNVRKNGTEQIGLLEVPSTCVNYLYDLDFENALKKLSARVNTIMVISSAGIDKLKNMMESIKMVSVFADEVDDKEISQNAKEESERAYTTLEIIKKKYEEGRGNEVIDELIANSDVIKHRPERRILLFEPFYYFGRTKEESKYIMNGATIHEIGHSLFTFDYEDFYSIEVKEFLEKHSELRGLFKQFVNMLEDGRITRLLINISNYPPETAKALITLSYRIKSTYEGANPIKKVFDIAKIKLNLNDSLGIFYDPQVATALITASMHYNITIDKNVVYDYGYTLLNDYFNKIKDIKKIPQYDELLNEFIKQNGRKPRNDKEFKKWVIDYLIITSPLWRFLYEKDTRGKTGYDYLDIAVNSKSTLKMISDAVLPLLKRYLVLYENANQIPPQSGGMSGGQEQGNGQGKGTSQQQQGRGGGQSSSAGQPQQQGGQGGQSGQGQQQRGQMGGGMGGGQGQQQSGGKTSGTGGMEGQKGQPQGKNAPLNPDADIELPQEKSINEDIGVLMKDMGYDDEKGSTLGQGSGGKEAGTSDHMNGGSSEAQQTDVNEDLARKVSKSINPSNQAKNEALNNLRDKLDESAKTPLRDKEGKPASSLDDIAKKFDKKTATGRDRKAGEKGGGGGSGKGGAGRGGGIPRNWRDIKRALRRNLADADIAIEEEIRRREEIKQRIPLADEVIPENKNIVPIPLTKDIQTMAHDFKRMFEKDIVKLSTKRESRPRRRGRKLRHTRLAEVITRPTTARPFISYQKSKDIIPPLNIFIMLDVSGSMQTSSIVSGIKTMKALYMAVKEINKKYGDAKHRINLIPIVFGTWEQYRGERIEVVAIRPESEFIAFKQGGTPTGEALSYIADKRAKTLTIKALGQKPIADAKDIIIILTDGEPIDGGLVKQSVDELKKNASFINIFVNGIMPKRYKKLFPENSVFIENVEESEIGAKIRENVRIVINKQIERYLKKKGYR